jgi:2-keto-4-pentenoate hydratase/2-oxohepta-3-ene-1,7-dioic acid hydratase in catechol pathway
MAFPHDRKGEAAMRLVRFVDGRRETLCGVLSGDRVELVQGDFFGTWQKTGQTIALADVRLLAPAQPVNLLCLGKNFRAFPGEQNPKFPKEPLLFIKATSAVVGPGDEIVLPAVAPNEVYYEAELAVVIKSQARNVSASDALRYVLGYTVANDVGARDCQASDGQWARAKSFDTFAPIGPWIETELEPGNCAVRSRVNGKPIQESTTALMIFDVPTTISYLSHCLTLLPGTVISMGSPGVLEGPRPLLKPGDVVEAEVEGIGILSNPVSAAKV